MRKLNKADLEILRELQADASRSNELIGEKVKRSASAVSRRIVELKTAKIITGTHAAIDPQRVGLVITVLTLVTLKNHGDGQTNAFEREVEAMPNVVELLRIGGSWDYLLKFMARDSEHHATLHQKLRDLPMVSRVRGMHVIGKSHTKPIPLE